VMHKRVVNKPPLGRKGRGLLSGRGLNPVVYRHAKANQHSGPPLFDVGPQPLFASKPTKTCLMRSVGVDDILFKVNRFFTSGACRFTLIQSDQQDCGCTTSCRRFQRAAATHFFVNARRAYTAEGGFPTFLGRPRGGVPCLGRKMRADWLGPAWSGSKYCFIGAAVLSSRPRIHAGFCFLVRNKRPFDSLRPLIQIRG